MTKKRFTIGMLKNFVNDNKTNYCYTLELQSDAKHLCNLLNALHEENEELKDAIIGKIQYGEDLEKFAIEKGLMQEDWARFDDYD